MKNKIISLLHWSCFLAFFLPFYPIFVLSKIILPKHFDSILAIMNYLHYLNIKFTLGAKFIITIDPKSLPDSAKNVILISNHQSMYDIPLIIWHFRKYRPKFIAKEELGKGLLTVSYILNNGGHLLINRQDKVASLEKIKKFASSIKKKKDAVVIFPEGTRAKDGKVKKFKYGGISALVNELQNDVMLVPIAIDGSWSLLKGAPLNLSYGHTVFFKSFPAIATSKNDNLKEILDSIEQTIKLQINSWRNNTL